MYVAKHLSFETSNIIFSKGITIVLLKLMIRGYWKTYKLEWGEYPCERVYYSLRSWIQDHNQKFYFHLYKATIFSIEIETPHVTCLISSKDKKLATYLIVLFISWFCFLKNEIVVYKDEGSNYITWAKQYHHCNSIVWIIKTLIWVVYESMKKWHGNH
jgi:hypothetical protein